MKVGSAVIYVDSHGVEREAIVTAVWGAYGEGPDGAKPSVNLVFVSGDESKTDQYGRQLERATSCPHRKNQAAPGNQWRER